MKKVLSMILTAVLVMALFSGTAFAGNGNGSWDGHSKEKMREFRGIKGHWGRQSVEKMQSWGILSGYADGTFQPDRTLTQGELAVIIARLLEARQADEDWDSEDEEEFDGDELSDVPDWAKYAVSKGFKKHYLNTKRFHSQVQCDRLTAAVAIAKALGLEPVTDFTRNPFKDRRFISDEDYGYLLALYEAGYIKGYPDGNFNPKVFLSRAHIASIIAKILEDGGTITITKDEEAPTWDSDSEITASDIDSDSVELEWTAADDDIKVVGYKVLYEVDGIDKVKYVTSRTATITGLDEEEEYTFTVEAKDAAGNLSDDGPSVTITTTEAVDDTEDPSWSDDSKVTATAVGSESVELKWSGAEDDIKVVSYKVTYEYNDTEKTKYFDGTTGKITGLEAEVEYTFTVEAKDAAGNWSDDGPSVTVTTHEEDTQDTSAPTWPSGSELTISSSDSGIVTIVWPDAEDNEEVTAYKLYKNGTLIQTLNGTANNATVTGLDDDTEYSFKIKALDAAGNLSTSLTKSYLTTD